MALINCPECGKEISDKAVSCPHCGMPLQAMLQPTSISPSEVSVSEHSKPKKKANVAKILIGLVISATLILGLVVCYFIFFKDKHTEPKELDLEATEKSVVKVVCYDWLNNISATGSGFMYLDARNVVTNYHVIKDAYRIEIVTYDDQVYDVELILNMSPLNDIALLRPKNIPYDFPYLSNDTDKKTEIAKGDKVYAIGSPLGIKNTVSEGIVSGWIMDGDMQAIQCTAPISPGSSGGALLDEYGNVIGITYSSYTAGQNINLAIPIKYATELWDKRSNDTNTNVTYEYLQNHEYGKSADLYARVMAEKTDCISFESLKTNAAPYQLACFDGYVSGFDTINEKLTWFSISNGSVISGDVYSDTDECLNYGIKGSSFILVNFSGMPVTNNEIRVGDYVRVCAFIQNDELDNGVVIGQFIVCEETGGYFSVIEDWLNVSQ